MFNENQLILIGYLIFERIGDIVSLYEIVEGEDLKSLAKEQDSLMDIYSLIEKMRTN